MLTHVILLVVQRRSSVVEARLDARPRPVRSRVRVQEVEDEVRDPVRHEAEQKRRHDHHDLLDDRQPLTGLRFIESLLEGRDAVAPDIPSTLARQLAFYIAIYSPIQMVADLPENITAYPQALDFVKRVAVDWHDSRLLEGAVGEYAVIARQVRDSDAWFIGGVTDESGRQPECTGWRLARTPNLCKTKGSPHAAEELTPTPAVNLRVDIDGIAQGLEGKASLPVLPTRTKSSRSSSLWMRPDVETTAGRKA